ncbi:hypothetical protein Droror1_Dr00000569 [Drosera rotundifolia]
MVGCWGTYSECWEIEGRRRCGAQVSRFRVQFCGELRLSERRNWGENRAFGEKRGDAVGRGHSPGTSQDQALVQDHISGDTPTSLPGGKPALDFAEPLPSSKHASPSSLAASKDAPVTSSETTIPDLGDTMVSELSSDSTAKEGKEAPVPPSETIDTLVESIFGRGQWKLVFKTQGLLPLHKQMFEAAEKGRKPKQRSFRSKRGKDEGSPPPLLPEKKAPLLPLFLRDAAGFGGDGRWAERRGEAATDLCGGGGVGRRTEVARVQGDEGWRCGEGGLGRKRRLW